MVGAKAEASLCQAQSELLHATQELEKTCTLASIAEQRALHAETGWRWAVETLEMTQKEARAEIEGVRCWALERVWTAEEEVVKVRAQLYALCEHAHVVQERRTSILTLQSTLDWICRQNTILGASQCSLSKCLAHAPDTVRRAVDQEKCAQAIRVKFKTRLKKHGVITPAAWATVCELVALGVPVKKVNEVLAVLTRLMGVAITGSIDGRSVRRIVLEGGIAAKIQLVEEIASADGVSILGCEHYSVK